MRCRRTMQHLAIPAINPFGNLFIVDESIAFWIKRISTLYVPHELAKRRQKGHKIWFISSRSEYKAFHLAKSMQPTLQTSGLLLFFFSFIIKNMSLTKRGKYRQFCPMYRYFSLQPIHLGTNYGYCTKTLISIVQNHKILQQGVNSVSFGWCGCSILGGLHDSSQQEAIEAPVPAILKLLPTI